MIKGASRVLFEEERQSGFLDEVLHQLAADSTNEEHRKEELGMKFSKRQPILVKTSEAVTPNDELRDSFNS